MSALRTGYTSNECFKNEPQFWPAHDQNLVKIHWTLTKDKMSKMKDLFKLSFDDSAFQRVFQSFESRLNQHDELLMQLQRLLQEKASQKDLDALQESLRNEFSAQLKQLENALTARIDSKLEKLELFVREQVGGANEFADIAKRMQGVEETAQNSAKTVNELKYHVQTIATSYGQLNKVPAPLGRNLERALKSSTDYVTNSFAKIMDELNKHQSEIEDCKKSISEFKPVEMDLEDLNPQPNYVASWRDPPVLPEVEKFAAVKDAVGYVYELVPKLQGYMNAMHGRIVDTVDEMAGMLDKEGLERLLEKLRKAIVDMDDELSELKSGLRRNVTRADVIAMINEALGLQTDVETSVGAVKCIACGREMVQVVGASSEADATRRLGTPVNSLTVPAVQGGGAVGQMFSNADTLQTGIVEQPRSIRPFRAACKVSRQTRVRSSIK